MMTYLLNLFCDVMIYSSSSSSVSEWLPPSANTYSLQSFMATLTPSMEVHPSPALNAFESTSLMFLLDSGKQDGNWFSSKEKAAFGSGPLRSGDEIAVDPLDGHRGIGRECLFGRLLYFFFLPAAPTLALAVPRTFFFLFFNSLICFLPVFFFSITPCRANRYLGSYFFALSMLS